MKYEVLNLEDNIYQVIFEKDDNDDWRYWPTVLFQGTLTECETWISLKTKEYL